MTITIPFWIIPVAGFICGAIGAMTFDLLNRKKKCNHTALIDKETISNEIERRYDDNLKAADQFPSASHSRALFSSAAKEDFDILSFLDTLPEQPASDGLEREIIRYKVPFSDEREYLNEGTLDAIARHFYELGCTRTAVMYDDIEYNRQRAEGAELSDDLEEEIDRFIDAVDQRTGGRWSEDDILECARHFAEWGMSHSFTHHEPDESLKQAVLHQMEDDGDVDEFVRRGLDEIVLKYAQLGAEWGAECIKSMIQNRCDENCRCAEKIKSFGIRACEDNDILSLIENRYE